MPLLEKLKKFKMPNSKPKVPNSERPITNSGFNIPNSKFQILNSIVAISFILVFISVSCAHAAELTFSSPQIVRGANDTYAVDLILDTKKDNINTLEASISYSDTDFDLKNVLTGDSVINFWIQKPAINNNLIHFVGSIPAGYSGSNGKIVTLVFQPKTETRILVLKFLNDSNNPSRVFLNDPSATEKSILVNQFSFNLDTVTATNLTTSIVDKERPDPFTIAISPSSSLPLNNVFVIFNTEDNSSGIDYYEMAQANTLKEMQDTPNLNWQKIESPTVLNLAQAPRFLAIKAVDKASNFEISVADLKPSKTERISHYVFTLVIVSLIIILVISSFYYRMKRNK